MAGPRNVSLTRARRLQNLSWIMSRRRKQDATTPSCIEAAYLYTDAQLRRRSILESGVTVATVLFVDEGGDRVLYSANAGDTRAVLASWDATSNRVVSKRLSMDHKPSLASEVARVKDAGGFIAGNRVNGVLAVSRALGDHVLKPSVSAVPHISASRRRPDPPGTMADLTGRTR